MPYAKNGDVNIYYEIEGEGPPLLLVHGFTADISGWKALGYVNALKENYRLILIDARGHGKSDKPHEVESYTTEHRVGDVIAVMDDINVTSAHYFGISYGGRIGFQMAKYAPERIKSIIILGASVKGRNFDTPGPIRQLLEADPEAMPAIFDRFGPLPEEIRANFLANDFEALIAADKSSMPDLEGELPNMAMPFLIIIGEADMANPHQQLKEVFEQLPDATFVTLPGLDHGQSAIRLDLVIPHVKEFLARVSK